MRQRAAAAAATDADADGASNLLRGNVYEYQISFRMSFFAVVAGGGGVAKTRFSLNSG